MVAPPGVNGRPGRPPRKAFAFAAGEKERFEALLDDEQEIGVLKVGLQVVCVDSEEKMEALAEMLAQRGVLPSSVWTVELGGERPELMVLFPGPEAVDEAGDLLGAFKDAELKARRASISSVRNARDQIKAAQRRMQSINRSRLQRRARQVGPRTLPRESEEDSSDR
jgi:hypothetical protein